MERRAGRPAGSVQVAPKVSTTIRLSPDVVQANQLPQCVLALLHQAHLASCEPVHVHGKCQGRDSRAEIILVEGVMEDLDYTSVAGRGPVDATEMR
jgi:hypothetical protein